MKEANDEQQQVKELNFDDLITKIEEETKVAAISNEKNIVVEEKKENEIYEMKNEGAKSLQNYRTGNFVGMIMISLGLLILTIFLPSNNHGDLMGGAIQSSVSGLMHIFKNIIYLLSAVIFIKGLYDAMRT